ncbi:hypothetical protein HS048_08425 [Planomonospora sp. ID91781]|uniref:hypothetical protein n=1 Tax=Planomonospora sp. ID91781 TaxID=2738135 RepID=UPI0018C38461|nr:hypothetical protein [Planomonospora sp. ID91781]MBG0820758.1 hypothetical protein [Planomonospora sp. ID91781]
MTGLQRPGPKGAGEPGGVPAGAGAAPEDRRRLSPAALLAVVALCYAAAQVVLVSVDFQIGWDEAVYLSQFSANDTPLDFHPSRGWGTSLVVAPVVMITNSVAALRVYLTVVSSLLLFGSFRIWLAVRPGYTVPLAAALYAGCWSTVFYGNAAMPNLYTAFGSVALTGLVLRAVTAAGPVGRALPVAVAVVAASMTLFRPTDATVVALALAAAVLLFARGRRWGPMLITLTALGAGLAAGWGQWLLEAVLEYGGVAQRLDGATQNFSAPRWLLDHHLRALDGPTLCRAPESCGPVPGGGPVWLAAVVLLGVAGLLAAWRRECRTAIAVPAAVGACFAVAYLYYGGVTAPRYMLPVLGLWAIAAAEGLLSLAGEARRRAGLAAAVACCVLVVGGHLHLQKAYLAVNVGPMTSSRAQDALVAEALGRLGHRRPCLVYGWHAPQIAHPLGCEALGTAGGSPLPATPASVLAKPAEGYTVIAVYRDDADAGAPELAAWPEHRLTSSGWHARLSGGGADPAPAH